MRRNRDSLLLLIALIPALFLIYSFFTWQTTGQWPVSAPPLNLPNLSTPSFLQPLTHLRAPLRQLSDRVTQNWFTVGVGVTAGLIFGVLLVGVVADVFKVLFGFGRPASARAIDRELVEGD